jgi:hypothetical protein
MAAQLHPIARRGAAATGDERPEDAGSVRHSLARHESLDPADGPIGPVDELQHVCSDELDLLRDASLVELLSKLPGLLAPRNMRCFVQHKLAFTAESGVLYLGLHLDVFEILRDWSAGDFCHLCNIHGLMTRGREISHMKRSSHGTLRKRLFVDYDVYHGTSPLFCFWIILMLGCPFRFSDIKVI